jgi:hypothetical protein
MLDNFSNQASGLLGLGTSLGPRMVAVVSHGDEQAELPLLWQLCIVLINFGYAVTVLDATTVESDVNPGLAQLLDNAPVRNASSRDTPAWTVLAAGQGVERLSNHPTPQVNLRRQLGQLFPIDSILILYARVDWMIPLVSGSGIEPLLAVSQSKASLLTSYMALKRLLITGELTPTIVNMVQNHTETPPSMGHPFSTNLSECARRFLGHEVRTIKVTEQSSEDSHTGELQRLALRLVESAVTLVAKPNAISIAARSSRFERVEHFAESH